MGLCKTCNLNVYHTLMANSINIELTDRLDVPLIKNCEDIYDTDDAAI